VKNDKAASTASLFAIETGWGRVPTPMF